VGGGWRKEGKRGREYVINPVLLSGVEKDRGFEDGKVALTQRLRSHFKVEFVFVVRQFAIL